MIKIPENVLKIFNVFNTEGYELYLVGGCVRDMLMDKEPKDWDMCTNATPDEMLALCKEKHYTVNPKGVEYGTVTIVFGKEEYEITTYRADTDYTDGRRPDSVEFVSDIYTDLRRRDFTINALAMNPITNILIDVSTGVEDIQNKVIRTVGNPRDRFDEDALRILRALRFAITLEFDIDYNTLQVLKDEKYISKLSAVSDERITSEFRKIFKANKPVSHWFIELHDLIFTIIPDLHPCYKFNQNNRYHKHDIYEHILAVVDAADTDKFEIKMAALFHDIGKPLAYSLDEEGHGHFYGHPKYSAELFAENKVFKFTHKEFECIRLLVEKHDIEIVPTKKYVRKLISNYGYDFVEDFIVLKRADISDHLFPADKEKPMWYYIDEFEQKYKEVREQENEPSLKNLAINGRDVMSELGIKEGKEIGKTLQTALDAVIEERVPNDKAALLTYLREAEKNE